MVSGLSGLSGRSGAWALTTHQRLKRSMGACALVPDGFFQWRGPECDMNLNCVVLPSGPKSSLLFWRKAWSISDFGGLDSKTSQKDHQGGIPSPSTTCLRSAESRVGSGGVAKNSTIAPTSVMRRPSRSGRKLKKPRRRICERRISRAFRKSGLPTYRGTLRGNSRGMVHRTPVAEHGRILPEVSRSLSRGLLRSTRL